MPLNSMTGFARTAGQDDRTAWTWEARSVNGKSLDMRCRVPYGFDMLEQTARKAVSEMFKRGNISLSLSVDKISGNASYQINRDLLDQVLALRTELAPNVRDEMPTLEGLLAIRGMIEPLEETETEEAAAVRVRAISATLDALLTALAAARAEEGRRLEAVITAHLEMIAGLIERATNCAAAQPDMIRERLRALVAGLLAAEPALPEDRLTQEAAILIGKADIREELDRLRAHIEAAKDLLADGVAVGRRFDFLCQEFNREANTLCSKSTDVDLTRLGLDLKASIEQLREQIQNIE